MNAGWRTAASCSFLALATVGSTPQAIADEDAILQNARALTQLPLHASTPEDRLLVRAAQAREAFDDALRTEEWERTVDECNDWLAAEEATGCVLLAAEARSIKQEIDAYAQLSEAAREAAQRALAAAENLEPHIRELDFAAFEAARLDAIAQFDSAFEKFPWLRTRFYQQLAMHCCRIGRIKAALELYEKSEAVATSALGKQSRTYVNLVRDRLSLPAREWQGGLAPSEFETLCRDITSLAGTRDRALVLGYLKLSECYNEASRPFAAAVLAIAAIRLQLFYDDERALGFVAQLAYFPNDHGRHDLRDALMAIVQQRGSVLSESAAPVYQTGLDLAKAEILSEDGDFAGAMELVRDRRALAERVQGSSPYLRDATLRSIEVRAMAYAIEHKQADAALEILENLRSATRAWYGEDDPEFAVALVLEAQLRCLSFPAATFVDTFRRAQGALDRTKAMDFRSGRGSYLKLARLWQAAEEPREARVLADRVIARLQVDAPCLDVQLADALELAAELAKEGENNEESKKLAHEAAEVRKANAAAADAVLPWIESLVSDLSK